MHLMIPKEQRRFKTYVQNTSFVKQMSNKNALDGFLTDFSDLLLILQLLDLLILSHR